MEENYTIKNNLMFALVMQNEEVCKGFIERIFEGREVKDIEIKDKIDLSAEKTIITGIESKSIRLDVLFTDETAWYDVEMQVQSQFFSPQRMRYYASSMDTMQMGKGEKNYRSLKKNYVIFICLFDYFKLDEPIYEFENYDIKRNVRFGDESYKIVLNVNCSEEKVPNYLKGLYSYIKDKVVPEDDELISNIDSLVTRYSKKDEVMSNMTLAQEIEIEKEIMRDLGRQEGRLEDAKRMKDDSLPVDLIAKYTGLTVEEIERL